MQSGIRLLPLMLSTVLASITNGIATQKITYYTPSAIIGSCIMSIGAGLLTTLDIDTSEGKWIGYQILFGFGMGMCFQAPNLAAQTVLPTKDVPIGTSLMFFMQLLGAAVFIPVGEHILSTQLMKKLSGLPGLDPKLVTASGATSLADSVPPNLRETVLVAYNAALRDVFRVGLIVTCLVVIGVSALEWKSIKKPQLSNEDQTGDDQATEKSGEQ